MTYFVGIDGGGTRTTVGIADRDGCEILRTTGPAGIVDPRHPERTAELLVSLIREAERAAGFTGPAAALCAGLAGVENRAERAVVERALVSAGVATRISVISDGETALYGALGGSPGILVIAGTGSVAYGRSPDGRLERCGGWGMMLGDEGSGFQIGRAGLRAALLAVDGRGPPTELLPLLLDVLGLTGPDAIPPWIGRAPKADVSALAVHVMQLAQTGDSAAREIIVEAALDLAAHVDALVERLSPWDEPPCVVLHGGLAAQPTFAAQVEALLENRRPPLRVAASAADAVSGAIGYATGMG
jgi:glucosamine kinase